MIAGSSGSTHGDSTLKTPAPNAAMSEGIRGMIVFMDGRYLWENYRKVIPKDYELVVSRDLKKEICEFFKDRGSLEGYS